MSKRLDNDELLHVAWRNRRAEQLRMIAVRAADEYRVLIERHGLEEEITAPDVRAVRRAWRALMVPTNKGESPCKNNEPPEGGSPD